LPFFKPEDLRLITAPGARRWLVYENETLFLNIEMDAGFAPPAHDHTWPALYYLTSGTGRVLLGDTWQVVGPGSLVMIPAHTMHTIEATTDMTMVEVQSNCPQWFVDGLVSGGAPTSQPR
jgi:quercetin dioxygenase-like cupin family protein